LVFFFFFPSVFVGRFVNSLFFFYAMLLCTLVVFDGWRDLRSCFSKGESPHSLWWYLVLQKVNRKHLSAPNKCQRED